MAWPQQYPAETWRLVPETVSGRVDTARSDRRLSCAGCTRLIRGDIVMVGRERYCSEGCVVEGRRASALPGNYLG
jgi:hypothetical protein